jgi:hypothetical protein
MGARASETHIIVEELEMLRSSPEILDTKSRPMAFGQMFA